jgi:hypothetical protein
MDLHLFSLYPLRFAIFLGLEAYHNVRRNLGESIRVASFKLNILYLVGFLLILYYFSCRFHFWLLDQFEISIVEYLLRCQTSIMGRKDQYKMIYHHTFKDLNPRIHILFMIRAF